MDTLEKTARSERLTRAASVAPAPAPSPEPQETWPHRDDSPSRPVADDNPRKECAPPAGAPGALPAEPGTVAGERQPARPAPLPAPNPEPAGSAPGDPHAPGAKP